MRRAAISVPANIAEEFRKRGENDKTRFLNVAQGSLEESRYYLILIQDLGYGTATEIEPLLEEVSRLLVPTPEPSSRTGSPLNSATPELLQLLNSFLKIFPVACQRSVCSLRNRNRGICPRIRTDKLIRPHRPPCRRQDLWQTAKPLPGQTPPVGSSLEDSVFASE
jgi:23S rRNA-intervening sequence protein